MKAGKVQKQAGSGEQKAAEEAKSPFQPKRQHSSSRRISSALPHTTFTFSVCKVNNHPHEIVMTQFLDNTER